MDWAWAAHLISASFAGDEANEAEDLAHGEPGTRVREANTRHGGGFQNPVQGCRGPRAGAFADGTANREEEPVPSVRGLEQEPADRISILTYFYS